MATPKKAVKAVKAAKKSPHAGKVAPPLAAQPAAKITDAIKVKVAVDADDFRSLSDVMDRGSEIATRCEAAAQAVSQFLDAGRDAGVKQLHRRVVVAIYDAADTRITNAEYHLGKEDELTLALGPDVGITASWATVSR